MSGRPLDPMAPALQRVLRFWGGAAVALLVGLALGSCDTARSVRFYTRSPVVMSLTAFPETIGPGDSAIVVCNAMDPDGDSLVYDWFSDCRLVKKNRPDDLTYYNARESFLVVRPGSCIRDSVDTAWVSCEVRDGRGGGAYAGTVHIIVRQ